MATPDYRGARGSNAGDDFHELWVLRKALSLLDSDSRLAAISVEGLRAEDESGTPSDTWDGVDCTLYYGGDSTKSADLIEIVQLKYSASNPDKPWTLASLAQKASKQPDSSVIGRLAKAYNALQSSLIDRQIRVKLVTNRPVDSTFVSALSQVDTDEQDRNSEAAEIISTLEKASGLTSDEFRRFAACLDVSGLTGSRFSVEAAVLTVISSWTDDSARGLLNDLLRFVRQRMMPESKGELITSHTVLAQLGLSDPGGLFPCPSQIKQTKTLIPRAAAEQVVSAFGSSQQYVCLHGSGGCGKTTLLQDIERRLPKGSVMFVFDCYGGGHYRDSDAFRHRAEDAFLQLCNDVATRFQVPLLITSSQRNYARSFKRRIEKASEVLRSSRSDALLVIAVDAADNSFAAANLCSPPEKSFVHDFMTLGGLPPNVRLVVTARTARLSELGVPQTFIRIPVSDFTKDETAIFAKNFFPSLSQLWIDDFYDLSKGNPRVERYALENAGGSSQQALELLRPSGKGLHDIFRERLNFALSKSAKPDRLEAFCAAVSALPHPIPLEDLSAITELSQEEIRDIASDLAPGLPITDDELTFADEDFEFFIESQGAPKMAEIRGTIAKWFNQRSQVSEYAAFHLAPALFAAGLAEEVLALVKREPEPVAIVDPMRRRDARLARLRIAMSACGKEKNIVGSLQTILIGAEATKSDAMIQQLVADNPDLAVRFMFDSATKPVLRDPTKIQQHGSLLFQMMLQHARDGNSIAARADRRQLSSWLSKRQEQIAATEGDTAFGARDDIWEITNEDIAAETHTVLLLGGPAAAYSNLRRWTPQDIGIRIARLLVPKLIVEGKHHVLEELLSTSQFPLPWHCLFQVPLAIAGHHIDTEKLSKSLLMLWRRKLLDPDKIRRSWRQDISHYLAETAISGCELIVARGEGITAILPILNTFLNEKLRKVGEVPTYNAALFDLQLRAFALVKQFQRENPALKDFLIQKEDSDPVASKQMDSQMSESSRRTHDTLNFALPLYTARARIISEKLHSTDIDKLLADECKSCEDRKYSIARDIGSWELRKKMAQSLSELLFVPSVNPCHLFSCVQDVFSARALSAEDIPILSIFATRKDSQQAVLSVVTTRAQEIQREKAAAQDKVDVLLSLSRLVLPLSEPESSALFQLAYRTTEELDADAIFLLKTISNIAHHARSELSQPELRSTAAVFNAIVTDAAMRLSGRDGFPWHVVSSAISSLDPGIGLASVARWEDDGVVSRDATLPDGLRALLESGSLRSTHAAALSVLLDSLNEGLVGKILEFLDNVSKEKRDSVVECLARLEIFECPLLKDSQLQQWLTSRRPEGIGPWGTALLEKARFLNAGYNESSSNNQREEPTILQGTRFQIELSPKLEYKSVNDLKEELHNQSALAAEKDTYLPKDEFFILVREKVSVTNRIAHLNALVDLAQDESAHTVVKALVAAVEDWKSDSLAVQSWIEDVLPEVFTNLFLGFTGYLPYEPHVLRSLFGIWSNNRELLVHATFDAIEKNVQHLGAAQIYEVTTALAGYLDGKDAADTLKWQLERMLLRVPALDRSLINIADIPFEPAKATARFLFAMMSDVDVRIRWRAAHAVRQLARFADQDCIRALFDEAERQTEQSFRSADAQFYWMAARLWFVMSMDRAAHESGKTIAPYGRKLYKIATDTQFPHILIKSFAKSAVLNLRGQGLFRLDKRQERKLLLADSSPLKPLPQKDKLRQDIRTESRSRRFHFDVMDTLPYWYSPAVAVFAKVDDQNFVDCAETWILDRWGLAADIWEWKNEPRKQRFPEHSWQLWSHDHGSAPTIERFSTYVEWHAMFCTVGALLRKHPIHSDSWRTLNDWLEGDKLSSPPYWLADLRGVRPLKPEFWFKPAKNIVQWIDEIVDGEFLAEVELGSPGDSIIVDAYHVTGSDAFRREVRVSSALVRPETASALVRALQTMEDSWDYKLPDADEDQFELHVPPYSLVGWLSSPHSDLRIDKKDPLRSGVGIVNSLPGPGVISRLRMDAPGDGFVYWRTASGKQVFKYQSWSDGRTESEYGYREYGFIGSQGSRLNIAKEALREFLKTSGHDLIVEVEISKRDQDYGYRGSSSKESKEARYDRVFLLRKEGRIETSEGCVGTW